MTETERLARLAQVLRAVPAERFDLSDWDVSDHLTTPECGFSGCAVGWATRDLVLQAEGLRMSYGFPKFPKFQTSGPGWTSVREFFGMDQRDAEHLFSLSAYNTDTDIGAVDWVNPTPAAVADRIEQFLVRHPGEES